MLHTSRPTALLVAGGVVAGPLLLLTVLVDGATRPGYDPWRHGVSQLVLGDRGWLARLTFIAGGLLLLAFTVGVRRGIGDGPGATWGPRLLGAAAAGLVIAGVVPTDPALGYPPGEAQTQSLSLAGGIHQIGGALLFVGLVGAPIAWGRRFARQNRRGWAIYSFATSVLVAATAVSAGVVYRLVQRGLLATGPTGLLELASFVLGFTWIAVLAVHVLRPSDDTSSTA